MLEARLAQPVMVVTASFQPAGPRLAASDQCQVRVARTGPTGCPGKMHLKVTFFDS